MFEKSTFFMRGLTWIMIVILSSYASAQREVDSLLIVLEETMVNRAKYDQKKELRISYLKELKKDSALKKEEIYQINNNIITQYSAYSFNSILSFIDQNISLAKTLDDQSLLHESLLKLAKLLASSGQYTEGIDILSQINSRTLSGKLLNNYYWCYKKIYSDLSFYAISNDNKNKYKEYYLAYSDSLLARYEPSTEEYLAIKEGEYRDNRELEKCLSVNSRRLSIADFGTKIYSQIAFERSLIYEIKRDFEAQKKYLILSAISDIKCSVKDNASLTILSMLLFKENNIGSAHKYINFAFQDAEFYNSKLRFVLISTILPDITKAYELQIEDQKNQLQTFLFIISLLGLVLLISVFYVFKQIKHLKVTRNDLLKANEQFNLLNQKLNESNSELEVLYEGLSESSLVKEHYIGTFLNIHSNYIDKLDDYRKMVKKHIVSKTIGDLFEKTKSKELIDSELKLFYKNFDETFLHIFPNFVERINQLLVNNGQLVPKQKGLLNTELRIFALIRLGITDSSKIAKLLRYSVNTIYNYRVKVKNNSIGLRDDFENDVLKIGVVKK